MEYTYHLAKVEAEKQRSRQKKNYDRKVKQALLKVGDRVLLKKVAFTGKHKLSDKWEEGVYVVEKQPNEEIPVYVIRNEKGGRMKTVHRNMLLPVSYLYPLEEMREPSRKLKCNNQVKLDESIEESESEEEELICEVQDNSTHTSNQEIVEDVSEEAIEDTGSVNGSETDEEDDNLGEDDTVPRRSQRARQPPAWFQSGDYVTNFSTVINDPGEEYFV